MPIKEYECKDCGAKEEHLIRNQEDVPTKCGACGSEKLEAAISTYGGYQMYSGPSSVRPKGAGSFKKR